MKSAWENFKKNAFVGSREVSLVSQSERNVSFGSRKCIAKFFFFKRFQSES